MERTRKLPVPLWFAQLEEAPGSSVRAIWSPDFRPEALLDPAIGAPPHGPWAPWAMARESRREIPIIPERSIVRPRRDKHPDRQSRPSASVPVLMSVTVTRLVGLSSLHGLPVRGRRRKDGTLADGSQISPARF